jgi:hypothetical protein
MAEIARQHRLAVEIASFEDWDSNGRRFDLLTSAQAWHWVDPTVGAARAMSVLRSGGRIGLFWNTAVHSVDLQRRFDAVYGRYAPELASTSMALGRRSHERLTETDVAASLRFAGFSDVEIMWFGHEREYTSRTWLDHLVTHSDHRQLKPARMHILLDALGEEIDQVGGKFTLHYETHLVTGRRTRGTGHS